jgi:hypothetical protein
MKTPLRYLYNPAFFERLCPVLEESIPGFDSRDFIFGVFNNAWPDLELHERTHHVAMVLDRFLPGDFPAAMELVLGIAKSLKSRAFFQKGFEHLFLARYVESYNGKHPGLSSLGLQKLQELIDSGPLTEPLLLDNR